MPSVRGTRVGLVLGAGGTPGGAFIRAALAELNAQTRWTPDSSGSMVGTSVGALNAARLACQPHAGPTDPQQFQALASLARNLAPPSYEWSDRLVVPGRRLAGTVLARFGPKGTSRADYDVAAGPFRPGTRVVSVSRRNGRRRVADLHSAISPTEELYASAAIPGFAIPRVIDGAAYVDGAVWSTTNADLITPDDADALIVIAPMIPRAGGSLVQRSHRALLASEVTPWQKAGQPVVCILPPVETERNGQDLKAFAETARVQVRQAARRGETAPADQAGLPAEPAAE